MTVYKSPFGEIKNLYNGNAASFIKSSSDLQNNLNKNILIEAKTGKALTGRQAIDYIGKIHSLLVKKYGIKYDDVVCLFAPNSIYTPSIHHGILSSGAIVSPANIAYTPDELKFQLDTANVKLIITVDKLLDVATSAATTAKIIKQQDLINESKQMEISNPIDIGDSSEKNGYFCFSSGTSGVPKCVMSSHQNLTSNCQQQVQSSCGFYDTTKVYTGVLPMSHIYGLSIFVFTTFYTASTLVVFEAFDFEFLLQSIVKYKINIAHVVPPIVVLFAKSPIVDKYLEIKKYLQSMMSGAAPLSDAVIAEAESRIGASIQQGYGLTESSPVSHFFSYDPKLYKKSSVGWLVAGQEARIVKDDKDVKQGEPGELFMRGPNIMRGYLNNKKANDLAFENEWFKTGDIAVVDRHGQFYIVDRAKELIKSRGHQVPPAEVEGILLEHANVADCGVIGVDAPEQGTELPRAFVVLKDKSKSPAEIKDWLEKKVAKHKWLWGGIVQLDAIPKSPSGKILRRYLKDRQGDKVVGLKAKL